MWAEVIQVVGHFHSNLSTSNFQCFYNFQFFLDFLIRNSLWEPKKLASSLKQRLYLPTLVVTYFIRKFKCHKFNTTRLETCPKLLLFWLIFNPSHIQPEFLMQMIDKGPVTKIHLNSNLWKRIKIGQNKRNFEQFSSIWWP